MPVVIDARAAHGLKSGRAADLGTLGPARSSAAREVVVGQREGSAGVRLTELTDERIRSGMPEYLLPPFDVVPDFIPVLRFADDAIVVAIVLRFAIRHSGIGAIERHWPDSPHGLANVLTFAGLKPPAAPRAD